MRYIYTYSNISSPELITFAIDHFSGRVPPESVPTKYISHHFVPFLDGLEAIDCFLASQVKIETSINGNTSSSVCVIVETFVDFVPVFSLESQSFNQTLIHSNRPYNISPLMLHLFSLYWNPILIHS